MPRCQDKLVLGFAKEGGVMQRFKLNTIVYFSQDYSKDELVLVYKSRLLLTLLESTNDFPAHQLTLGPGSSLPWRGWGWCSWWSCAAGRPAWEGAWAPSPGPGAWSSSPASPGRRSCWSPSRSHAALGRHREYLAKGKWTRELTLFTDPLV